MVYARGGGAAESGLKPAPKDWCATVNAASLVGFPGLDNVDVRICLG